MYHAMGNGVGCCGSAMGDTVGWGTLPPECGPVSVIQQNLTKVGFPVKNTNKFDEATAYAYVDFQIAHNIPNSATALEICTYLAKVAAAGGSAGAIAAARPASWQAPMTGSLIQLQKKPTPLLRMRPGGALLAEGGTTGGALAPTTKKYLLYGGVALLAVGVLIMRKKKR